MTGTTANKVQSPIFYKHLLVNFHIIRKCRDARTTQANNIVSAQIIVIAWPPTFLSDPKAVFIPMAAIAVTKHQFDILRRFVFKDSGKPDMEPIGIRIINPIAKNGMGSFELFSEPCF